MLSGRGEAGWKQGISLLSRQNLQSSYVGVYFDVGNILHNCYPQQWIRILGSRILKVHVKDYRPGVGTGNGFVPLLSGDVNWTAVRSALEYIWYTDTVTVKSVCTQKVVQTVYDTSRHLDIILGGAAR